jgi:hypothetical protein
MKKIIIMFVVGLLTQQITQAQGITYLSNLGQPSIGSQAVGSDSWYAAGFGTGNNVSGYSLNSVQLGMTDASGNPSGFAVMLYAQSDNPTATLPGSSLGTLSGSTDPEISDIYTYAPTANLTLSPSTLYFIVLTAGTAVANGAYDWSLAGANSYNPSGGWVGDGGHVYTSSDGSSWTGSPATYPQFAINATPIPEPSPSLLIFLCSGVLLYVRRIKRQYDGDRHALGAANLIAGHEFGQIR